MRRRAARLVGRQEELGLVRAALVNPDARTRCVLVTGEAGIGKSRLVAEAVADVEDALVVTGHGADMTTGEIPFGVLADTLRDLLRQLGPDVLDEHERRDLSPLLPGPTTADVDRTRVMSTFLDLLERVASQRRRGLVWVVEDLQWADAATRDLVSLTVRSGPEGIVVLATVRTDEPEPGEDAGRVASYVAELGRGTGVEEIRLGRLSPSEVRELVADLLQAGSPPGLASRIAGLGDGVPFVIEELVATAAREPTSTATVAGARLQGLAPDTRRLLEAAAVGDGHLRVSLVEAVLEATPEEFDTALADAGRAGVLDVRVDEDALEFRHALVRAEVMRGVGPGARRAWHRRWAEVLETHHGLLAADPALLAIAEHWHQAHDVRRALAAAAAALPSAERVCLGVEQLRLWARMIESYDTVTDAEDVTGLSRREAIGRAHNRCAFTAPTEWNDLLDRLSGSRLDGEEEEALSLLRMDSAKGEHRVAGGSIHRAEEALSRGEESPMDSLSLATSCRLAGTLADDRLADRLLGQAASAAQRLGACEVLMVASVRTYLASSMGDPASCSRVVAEALAGLSDLSHEGVQMLIGNLVWAECILGHHERAASEATAALARLRRPHLSTGVWEHLLENLTASLVCTGDWTRARGLLEEANPWWQDDLRTCNARLQMLDMQQLGRTELSAWSAQASDPAPLGASRATSRWALALAAGSSGDLVAMRSALQPLWSEEQIELWDDEIWAILVMAARFEADARLGQGAPDPDGETHMAVLAAVAARLRPYGLIGEAWPLDVAAQADRFAGRDARGSLQAALDAWERVAHRPDMAVTHLSLAEAHATAGARDVARDHLRSGRTIAQELGAGPWLARAEQLEERHALGNRARTPEGVLTVREAEVLDLLAEGRTNAEIAAALFMSPKTASVHVSHIIAKLGAANRTEAAATARRQGLLQ